MIHTAIHDTFYLTDEQLKNSPSRRDGIDEKTETTLRIYGCDLIQESGILLRLPQVVMATGQVLFHRFYYKMSFARFNVERVAASCIRLASKFEESPRRGNHVLNVFHSILECRRRNENLPIEHYSELKMEELNITEMHLLKEMGFVCHVEHPHKFISNYLATLETPHPELRQEAWNLANDSLRTTLCVRFKSEVVACGVVYAAARRFQVPLPENPPWWKAFDADKSGIDEVCRVLAQLYSLPKAQYIPVYCKMGDSFTRSSNTYPRDNQAHPQVPKEGLLNGSENNKKSDDEIRNVSCLERESREPLPKAKVEQRTEASGKRNRERERPKARDFDRGRDSAYRERERDKLLKERSYRSRDNDKDSGGHPQRSKHHSSRDRGGDHCSSSLYSSRERNKKRERGRPKVRDIDRGRDFIDRERERDKLKERSHWYKEIDKYSGGHSKRSRHHSA